MSTRGMHAAHTMLLGILLFCILLGNFLAGSNKRMVDIGHRHHWKGRARTGGCARSASQQHPPLVTPSVLPPSCLQPGPHMCCCGLLLPTTALCPACTSSGACSPARHAACMHSAAAHVSAAAAAAPDSPGRINPRPRQQRPPHPPPCAHSRPQGPQPRQRPCRPRRRP